jgi:iron(III) transport system substrate-binding protein
MEDRMTALRFLPLAAILVSSLSASPVNAAELNLYTTREAGLIQPLLDKFTEKTGVKINTVFMKDGLTERVVAEGANSPADLLMTVDVGNLMDLVEEGVTQSIASNHLSTSIPAQLRDPNGHWYALSLRARALYAAKDRTDFTAFTYEQLADPVWKGKVCIRSGQHPYNTALIAAMIAKDGEAKTEAWLVGVKENLARKAGGGDRDVARDILGDICDIGLANSYYVGLMRSGKGGAEQEQWVASIRPILPTFANGGTHVNISGAAVAKHAPNKDNAVKLLEYLVSDEAQLIYAEANFEYPVKPGVATDRLIADLGTLTVDSTPLVEISAHRKAASELVDKVGFDD